METWDENEGGEENEAYKKLRDEKKEELGDAEEELGELSDELEERHDKSSVNMKKMVKASMKETSGKVENSDDEVQSWSSSMGAPAERPAGEKLDLAAKLNSNEKLRRLSLLVGSLKEEMLKGRRKSWSRRGAEVFDIASGDDLGRIIQIGRAHV